MVVKMYDTAFITSIRFCALRSWLHAAGSGAWYGLSVICVNCYQFISNNLRPDPQCRSPGLHQVRRVPGRIHRPGPKRDLPLDAPACPALPHRAARHVQNRPHPPGQRRSASLPLHRDDEPAFVVEEVKRKMGMGETIEVGDRTFSPAEISSFILRKRLEPIGSGCADPISAPVHCMGCPSPMSASTSRSPRITTDAKCIFTSLPYTFAAGKCNHAAGPAAITRLSSCNRC